MTPILDLFEELNYVASNKMPAALAIETEKCGKCEKPVFEAEGFPAGKKMLSCRTISILVLKKSSAFSKLGNELINLVNFYLKTADFGI